MENPWKNLGKENNEYIAECDKYFFNNKYYLNLFKNDYELKLNVMPGPYTGDLLNARVYLLALNPGYDENDVLFTNNYKNKIIDNLLHIFDDYPFMILNPQYKESAGAKWWLNKLSHLINNFGLENVANKVCNIEYFPYHSKKYKHLNLKLPSQEYSFSFVKKAIIENKKIIIMRSEKIWYNAIPELENYENKYVLNSSQNVIISPKNLGIEMIYYFFYDEFYK